MESRITDIETSYSTNNPDTRHGIFQVGETMTLNITITQPEVSQIP